MKTTVRVSRFMLIAATMGRLTASEPALRAVHEWGTFTVMSASNGELLSGLEQEEEFLPNFVHTHGGFFKSTKGLERPVKGVTVKMETPVLYFYATKPMDVSVAVDFFGGSISQWYPDRSEGEPVPSAGIWPWLKNRPIDFSQGYHGWAKWKVSLLPRGDSEQVSYHEVETPQWRRARVAGANPLVNARGEKEGFIFYRGVANLTLPLRIDWAPSGELRLKNLGADAIPFLFVYERPEAPLREGQGYVWWQGALPARSAQTARVRHGTARNWDGSPRIAFAEALVQAGLTSDEAAALLATWRESYFERPGLRVFWIVPRTYVDRVLPLHIEPRPAELNRVIVGRTEVLSSEFERELVEGFRTDGGKRWIRDRYYLAYQDRVRQLGVVVPTDRP